jgi:hypothetical protein
VHGLLEIMRTDPVSANNSSSTFPTHSNTPVGRMSPRRTVYRSAIVSPASETEVEVLSDALICVGPTGKIEWVEDLTSRLEDGAGDTEGAADEDAALALQQALQKYDVELDQVDFVRLEEGFLSPGFVDTHTVRLLYALTVVQHDAQTREG